MRFTSEDLMKAMCLQVGDRVKLGERVFPIIIKDEDIYYQDDRGYFHSIVMLIDQDFEILPRPKRVGDLKCEDLDCTYCPMKCLNCLDSIDKPETIYGRLERWFEHYKDQEIYDLLKARLDKVVSE